MLFWAVLATVRIGCLAECPVLATDLGFDLRFSIEQPWVCANFSITIISIYI
jgi:hypothetical protein